MINLPDNRITAMAVAWRGPVELIFRVSTALIFLIGGLGHFFRSAEMVERIAESPWRPQVEMIGDPLLLLHLTGAVFVAASIAMIIGFQVRTAALLLFVTLVPITMTIHIAPGHEGPLFKNIAILGALLHFFANGASCCAIDLLLARRVRSRAQQREAAPSPPSALSV